MNPSSQRMPRMPIEKLGAAMTAVNENRSFVRKNIEHVPGF